VKKFFLLLLTALTGTAAMAQMPVSLLDNDASANSLQWEAAAPVIQAGLECRQHINPDDPALSHLPPPNEFSQWELVPPKGFSVFGLPVQAITLYIDPTGEMGASYTASVAATEELVAKTLESNSQHENAVGSLRAQPSHQYPSLTDIICTVMGYWEHD